MAGRRKFGAFSGVFTPSILTILGVIMYLRLPQIVGQAGLWFAIGIVLAAHLISVTTGLSVSSIATDKRVKAGGSYYIISRSLGLPIGGTLGLALFVGLSFSVSLYLIGFAESFLTYWHIGIDPVTGTADIDMVRIAGSIALLVVTIVTFISTSLAIKTQYIIMAAIVLSLGSIFIGNADAVHATSMHLEPLAGGASIAVLFAIFFPAVTGFEAGVSMSGDLKNPRRDIPGGTLMAIAVGLFVYLGLVVFLAMSIPAKELADNPKVLLDYALSPALVIAGIWGATISSALGSILGAPRILQAVAMDKIAPKLFARGAGADNEPRNAVVVTFLIAEAGILIGSLDTIAAVVTMFFMASYGVLNLSCAVESWASPDFRPEFKIQRLVSIVGAIACFALMVMLDPIAMVGALATMGLVFVWLKRKELALEGGDTWTGIWASIARKALDRLSRSEQHHRNWRPNLLLFMTPRTPRATRALCQDLVAHNGVATELTIGGAQTPTEEPGAEAVLRREGVFQRSLPGHDPFEAMAGLARYHGIAGYEPNTVVIDWELVEGDPDRAAKLLSEMTSLGRQTVLSVHRAGAEVGPQRYIDVWWHGSSRNLNLGLALVRFLSITGEWVQATPRFMAMVADPAQKRTIQRRLGAWLADARVLAEVRVFDAPAPLDSFEALVTRVSANSAIVMLGLDDATSGEALQGRIAGLAPLQRPLLLLLADPSFVDPFPMVDLNAPTITEPSEDPGVRRERPVTLELGDDPALGRQVLAYHDALTQALQAWHADGPVPLLRPFSDVHADITRLLERALSQLERAADVTQPARRQRLLFRVERGLLRAIEKRLSAFVPNFGEHERDTLRTGLGVLSDRLRSVELGLTESLLVTGATGTGTQSMPPEVLSVERAGGHVREYLRWPLRQFVVGLHSRSALGAVKETVGQLREGREKLVTALDGLVAWGLSEVARSCLQLASGAAPAGPTTRAQLAEREAGWKQLVDGMLDQQRRAAATFSRDAAQSLATALGSRSKVRRSSARRDGEGPLDVDSLVDELIEPLARQRFHVTRAALDVSLRGLHRDLRAMCAETRVEFSHHMRRRTIVALEEFQAELSTHVQRLTTDPGASHEVHARDDITFDDQPVLQRMTEVIESDIEGLPEMLETLTETSFQALSEGRAEDLEEVAIEVRRLVAFVLKTDLLGPLREALAALVTATTRASNAVRDVARLVSFAASSDLGAPGGEQDELTRERLEIVAAGRERVAVERAQIERAWRAAEQLLDERLEKVIERTQIAAIGQSVGKLNRFVRTHERRDLGSRVAAGAARVRDVVRRGLVGLRYRWIRGVLLARRLEATAGEPASPVERIIALHRAASPSAEVADALPIFYRQVFLGRAAADPAYWLPHSKELADAEGAVDIHASGRPGVLWITGPQGSGVGAVLRRLTQKRFPADKTFVVRSLESGSIEPERFDAALGKALGLTGDVDEMLATLPEGSAVIIEELELWWERSPRGLAVVERLSALCERHGGRVLFIIGVNVHVMRLLRRLGVMVEQVLATVHCRPLEAQLLRDAVQKRHDATGLGLRLEGDSRERTPNDWKMARLFTGLFDHSDGYIGAALQGWIAHIAEVKNEYIVMRRPQFLSLDALDELDPEWAGLLLELVLHRRMDRGRLLRVTGLSASRLDAVLAGLMRTGLVTGARDDEPIALDRFMRRHLERWFESREVL